MGRQDPVGDLHLLFFGRFVCGGRILTAAGPGPGARRELQATEVAVAGVDRPVTARLVFGDLVPVGHGYGRRIGRGVLLRGSAGVDTAGGVGRWGRTDFAGRINPRLRVDSFAAGQAPSIPCLEMQVCSARAGRGHLAVVASVGDVLAGGDLIAGLDQHVLGEHVAVDGGPHLAADVVVQHNPLPEARGVPGGRDGAVGRGVDRFAGSRAEVDSLVHRAPAHTERACGGVVAGFHRLDGGARGECVLVGRWPGGVGCGGVGVAISVFIGAEERHEHHHHQDHASHRYGRHQLAGVFHRRTPLLSTGREVAVAEVADGGCAALAVGQAGQLRDSGTQS